MEQALASGRYDKFFSGLKLGQRVVCPHKTEYDYLSELDLDVELVIIPPSQIYETTLPPKFTTMTPVWYTMWWEEQKERLRYAVLNH